MLKNFPKPEKIADIMSIDNSPSKYDDSSPVKLPLSND
jgi:hypothetical protein